MMRIKNRFYVLRDAATGEGGEGGGGGGGDDGGAAAAATAAAAGEGGDAGGAGSALAAGGEGNPPAWSVDSIPDKFKVLKEDGTPDTDAMLAKIDQARSAAEKRIGSGDIPPKDFSGYTPPPLPEALKDVKLETEQFAKDAHAMGLTQKQYEGVMAKYYDILPGLVHADMKAQASEVVSGLSETWGEHAEANFQSAFRAANAIGESIGIPYSEIEKAVGNNPIALRILAAVGSEMKEDRTPANANTAIPAGFDPNVAMSSDAYSNANHPEHDKVTAQVNAHFDKLEKSGKL
jgi:hypothetical protein